MIRGLGPRGAGLEIPSSNRQAPRICTLPQWPSNKKGKVARIPEKSFRSRIYLILAGIFADPKVDVLFQPPIFVSPWPNLQSRDYQLITHEQKLLEL